MNRLMRIRRANKKSASGSYDILFPQTVTRNILRNDNGGVLETSLVKYDAHVNDSTQHTKRVLSTGTPSALLATVPGAVIKDGFRLLVTLHEDLESEPTLSVNGSPAANIVSSSGDNIAGGQIKHSSILVVWSETLNKWFLLNNDQSSAMTTVTIPVHSEYEYTAATDGVSLIAVPGYTVGSTLTVNFNQTILRPGIDYVELAQGAIRLREFTLNIGDTLNFDIIASIENSKKGLYKYRIETDTYVYTATDANTTIVDLSQVGTELENIVINYNQTVLIPDVDYKVNEDDDLELLRISLGVGDILHFTIFNYVELPDTGNYNQGSYSYTLDTGTVQYVAPEDNTTIIDIPDIANQDYRVQVNHYQLVLRRDIDYIIDDRDRMVLQDFALSKGEMLAFTITKYEETVRVLKADGGTSSGVHRYQLNVLHESYTATADDTVIVDVPNFNRKRDSIAVIRDNMYLIQNEDYIIDLSDSIVLTKHSLNTGDSIYFTIMQGCLIDTPRFNVTEASGNGGMLLVNIAYAEISDFYTLVVRLPDTLQNSPKIKFLDGPAEPILGLTGSPILGGNKPGSYLYLVRNEGAKAWYSLGDTTLQISTDTDNTDSITGISNFTGQLHDVVEGGYGETAIPHGLGVTPTRFEVMPCEPPTSIGDVIQPIGDIWTYADNINLYVGNSGTSTSRFRWTIYK